MPPERPSPLLRREVRSDWLRAEGTDVPVERSRAELEAVLTRYGADRFGSMSETDRAIVLFEVKGRRIVFMLPLPDKAKFTKRPWRHLTKTCTAEEQQQLWEQACRERWRALVLIVKAKLEAVRSGVTTFEDEFAFHFVMPNGQRLRDVLMPALDDVLSKGTLPPLMGLPGPTR